MTTENNTPDPAAEAAAAAAAAEAAKAEAAKQPPAILPITEDKPPAKEPAKKEDGKPAEVEPVTYNASGDAGLDMLLEAAGTLGLGPSHPAMVAAVNGDFDLLALKLEEAEVKGSSRLIALGQKAYNDIAAKTKARQEADAKAVAEEVGGPERWAEVQKWASENADDNEKAEIKAALGKGGLQARMAASWLNSLYGRASGVSDEGTGKAVAKDAKGTPAANGALSPREYAKAVAEARIGFKGDFENSSKYKDLQARRMAYRG